MKNVISLLTLLMAIPLFSQNVIADFEMNGASQIAADGGSVSIITGSGTNTTQVAELTNVGGSFENYPITLDNNLSLATDQTITLDFYNPDATNHLVWIRLNGATTDADVLVSQTSSAGPGWETLTFDFANAVIQSGCFCDPINASGIYDEMFVFIDGGTNIVSVTAIDNIEGGEESLPPATVDITYTVNMNGAAIAPTGIFIAKGVFGDAFLNPMFDDGTNGDAVAGDGIYSLTSAQPEGYSGEYIFTNGACGDYSCGESLGGLPCATGPDNVRFLNTVLSDTLVQHCFSNCSTDGTCTVTNVDITFTVNMANEVTDASGVYIAGGTDYGVPGTNPMFDDGTNGDVVAGDDVWTVVRSVPQGYTGLYAFANGACADFSCKESLVGLACATGPFSDRTVGPVSGNTLVQACFGQCTTDGSCAAPGDDVDITFSVNMANQTVSPTGVFIAGGTTFGAPGVNQMFDNGLNGDLIAGDNVYTTTVTRPSGFIGNYTFTNGNCPDYSCKEDISGLACADGPFSDRITGPITSDSTIMACFSDCSTDGSCPAPPATVDITFMVNMANQTVSPQGVYIAGGGNFGNPGDFPLFDDGMGNDFIAGDGVYTTTISKPEGFSGNYVFTNGACPDYSCKEQLVGLACADGPFADRLAAPIFSDTTLMHCFNECTTDGSCPVILNPGCTDMDAVNFDPAAQTNDGSCIYNVTLQVDMSCAPAFTTVNVVGPNVNGAVWCGACNAMFDDGTNGDAVAGDGIHSLSLLLSGDFEFKYAIDNFADQEYLVDDMQNGGSCAPITDFNSFANREITPSASYSDVNTYGSCGPCGDDQDIAITLSNSVFGVPVWSTHALGSSESMPGCNGDADDDIWFKFIATGENDMLIAGDPANGYDAVIEVFDGFMGSSIGCFNNTGAGLLEKAIPTGLIEGQEYYFRVYDAATGASASTDVRVQVKTYADGTLRASSCDVTGYELGQSVYALNDAAGELYSNPNVPVDAYEFRFEDQNGPLDVIASNDGMTPQIQLSQVPGLEYNGTYDVSVRHRLIIDANGTIDLFWSPWSSVCSVGLAPMASGTQLSPAFCNATDLELSDQIQAVPVLGAMVYEFTITDTDTEEEFVKYVNNYSLNLFSVPGLKYNAVYEVAVRANVNGLWSTPSLTLCSIATAAAPPAAKVQDAYCGAFYNHPSAEFLLATQVYGATQYTWKFTPTLEGEEIMVNTPTLKLRMNAFGLALPDGEYEVQVKVVAGGVSSDYDLDADPCFVVINEGIPVLAGPIDSETKSSVIGSSLETSIYPNPNSGEQLTLMLDGMSGGADLASVAIYDLTGKLIFADAFAVKGEKAVILLNPAKDLSAGSYIVRVDVDGSSSQMQLMVK